MLVGVGAVMGAPQSQADRDFTPPETTGLIGNTCMDLSNPYFKLIAETMTKEAVRADFRLINLDARIDPARQNSQLEHASPVHRSRKNKTSILQRSKRPTTRLSK